LTNWLQVVGAMKILSETATPAQQNDALVAQHAQWNAWRRAEAESEYQLEKLLAHLGPGPAGTRKKTRGQTTTLAAVKQDVTQEAKTPTAKPAATTTTKNSTKAAKPAAKKTVAKKAATSNSKGKVKKPRRKQE